MLRRLALRDVVIVSELELELGAGFSVLTGETGAGKSILVDALQLALGQRAEAAVVREGAARAEVSAEFDCPESLGPWLEEAGFEPGESVLLRRTVDAQGKSRGWINGSAATAAQLREAAEHLVDIHGQHAWQSLTRPAAVRALLDEQAGVDGRALGATWAAWQEALRVLGQARSRQATLEQERERLAWQIHELDKLAPGAGEWEQLEAEHQRLAHAQSLLDGARAALEAISDDETSAAGLSGRALKALDEVARFDPAIADVAEVVRGAQAQLEDAAHTLAAYLARSEPDPGRLAELDQRLAAWMSLARRWRRAPADLPALLAQWRSERAAIEAAADLAGLEAAAAQAEAAFRREAGTVSRQRAKAGPLLAAAVTQQMQALGMAGGRFEVALVPLDEPASFGLESVELRVAGHAGSTPRALARVASGGELSRLALAVAVSAAERSAGSIGTLIFDEIDAGVGGTVADSVGRLMKQLGRHTQVLAVTHLAQVAACADAHFVVAKAQRGKATLSSITPVQGEARVAEVARMLGGETLSGTAHAQALLHEPQKGAAAFPPAPGGT